ncbi:MAG: hypothetical protein HY817_01435 [Candidatus Abawacabacteria bacterium]|nr:hypothetical protein [Candidatus Abawacabacteria bacterium]
MLRVKFVDHSEYQKKLYLNGIFICFLSNEEIKRIKDAEKVETTASFEAIEEKQYA